GWWLLRRDGISFGALGARRSRLCDRTEWWRLFSVNGDIFVRTLALLVGFGWFSRQGAGLGDAVRAGNHILQQMISVSAFFLDGVAFVAESLVGAAFGGGDRGTLARAVRRTSLVALGFGLTLGATILVVGPHAIAWLTHTAEVQSVAAAHLPFAA